VKFKRQQLEDKMGLDMYLNAKRYLWNVEEDLAIKLTENFPELSGAKINEVKAEVAYWRKSNAVHKWFVDNVQNGVDDCGYYELGKDELKQLLEVVLEVLANRGRADELLPTASGFFFGDTKYDKYYFQDLEYTRDQLIKLTEEDSMKGWYFEYHSSW
jgi:homoserine trans-succinylase